MLVIKIELWSARTGKQSEIGRMYIANGGDTTDPKLGDYSVAVCRRGSDAVPQPINPSGPKATRVGSVNRYPRLAYNIWRLVLRALRSAFPEEQ